MQLINCQFCNEDLDYTSKNGTAIYSHKENGCDFITFSYNSSQDLENLTSHLNRQREPNCLHNFEDSICKTCGAVRQEEQVTPCNECGTLTQFEICSMCYDAMLP